MDLVGALTLMLVSTPNLRDASCRGEYELFDAAAEPGAGVGVRDAAIACCRRCPVLAQCSDWEEGLRPHARPAGIVAGRRPPPHTRKDGPPRYRGPRP